MSLDLYEAIGGRAKINAAVALFYTKVLADPTLREFFSGTEMDGLRGKQAMFLSMLLGGSQRYSGREIGEAHAGARKMGLTEQHFQAFVGHLESTLAEIGVAPEIIKKIVEQVETTRSAVLGR